MENTQTTKNEDRVILKESFNHRHAVRAIIFVEDKLVMLQSQKYHEYKFPGGGVKEGENLHHTLKREVFEETGMKISDAIQNFGYIIESRASQENSGRTHKRRVDYFLCKVEERDLPQDPDKDGKEYDYQVTLVSVEEALKINESISEDSNLWNRRECRMLRQLIAANLIHE